MNRIHLMQDEHNNVIVMFIKEKGPVSTTSFMGRQTGTKWESLLVTDELDIVTISSFSIQLDRIAVLSYVPGKNTLNIPTVFSIRERANTGYLIDQVKLLMDSVSCT